MVKVSLKKLLGRAFITLTALQTIIVEVEATLNDRPLTYLSSNTEDPEPLTPSHLLCGHRIASLPHPLTEDDESFDPDYYTSNQMRSARNITTPLPVTMEERIFNSLERISLSYRYK